MAKRRGCWVAALTSAFAAVAAPAAQAAYVATFAEVGSNVVEVGGGTLDLTDLERSGGIFTKLFVAPSEPSFISGTKGDQGDIYAGALSGPANWGSGLTTFASSSSGDLVGLVPSGAELIVPDDYVFGDVLSETSTYLGASFASLGLTPGSYVYNWGTGEHADTFTLNVVTGSVPEPSTWAMMLLGFAGLGYAAVRRKSAILG
jgi:PEP-CTERM motif